MYSIKPLSHNIVAYSEKYFNTQDQEFFENLNFFIV